MEENQKRGRPNRKCLDDVEEWRKEEIRILKRKAQDRDAWKMIVKMCIGLQRVMYRWSVGWMDRFNSLFFYLSSTSWFNLFIYSFISSSNYYFYPFTYPSICLSSSSLRIYLTTSISFYLLTYSSINPICNHPCK